VTQRSGGVGSLKESFNQALIQGSAFISIDNVRGKIDSQAIESFLTEDTYLARVPYSPPMKIDPQRTVLMFTSNRAELTRDLANRSNCVRVLNRPDGYRFRRYPQGHRQRGSILDQVQACQPKFLAAVFAIVRAWYDAGQPVTEESRHDFEGWAQSLDWVVQDLLGGAPLMDGHKEPQIRLTSPALSWLRDVAHAVERAGRLGDEMQAHAILDIIDGDPDTSVPGIDPDDDVENEEVRSKALRAMGRRLAKCFQGETVTIDSFTVTRCEARDEDYRARRSYLFDHDPRIATPINPAWTNNEENLSSEEVSGGKICSLLPYAGYAGVEDPCGGDSPDDTPAKPPAERGWVSAAAVPSRRPSGQCAGVA
jgi:hypothetical protein